MQFRESNPQVKIREQYAHKIRSDQKMRIFSEARRQKINEYEDELYYSSMERFFY